MKLIATFFAAILTIGLIASPFAAFAGDDDDDDDDNEMVEFDDSRIWIEINGTDGDSGLQIFLDGEGWRKVKLINPKGKKVLHIKGSGGVGKTGLTEMFFESAEPGFDELPLEDFEKRFPEGEYRFVGKTVEGDKIKGKATLTHTYPDIPVLLSPEVDSVQDPNNVVIMWQTVADPPGSSITRYEVIVEQEDTEPTVVLSAILPPTATSMAVPAAFMHPNTEYKYEVLATEESGNRTLAEAPFRTGP